MNAFDWLVLAVLALSAIAAFARGIVRSLVALVAWIVGLIAALVWTPAVSAMLPAIVRYPLVPPVVAFVLIFVVVLVAGALIAWPLHALIHGAGLGFVDRALGAVFGVARGVLLALAFVLAAGLTALPAADWWQNSLFARPLAEVALSLRPWLPPQWGERLDYSGRGGSPATDRPAAGKAI
jgi:membrane protein required for colicin V production